MTGVKWAEDYYLDYNISLQTPCSNPWSPGWCSCLGEVMELSEGGTYLEEMEC